MTTTSIDTAPRDIALGADGDILMVDGDWVMLFGTDAIVSDLKSRLGTQQGECFLDSSKGVPWRERVLGKKYNQGELPDLVRTEALGTPGVSSVDTLTASMSGRTLRAAVRATAYTGAALDASLAVALGGI